jgi:hypothetical protein
MTPSSVSSPAATARGRQAGLLLLVAPFLLGADDSYLREIEAEVKRQATTLITVQARPEPATAAAADAATDRLAAGLDQPAFERTLRETLPGTYTLYQQLDPNRKQQVYEAYRNDNRLAEVSERVIQLLDAKP